MFNLEDRHMFYNFINTTPGHPRYNLLLDIIKQLLYIIKHLLCLIRDLIIVICLLLIITIIESCNIALNIVKIIKYYNSYRTISLL